MRTKMTLLLGAGIGYVLGSRAGRERYEQIRVQAQKLWSDPRVQEKVGETQNLAGSQLQDIGSTLRDLIGSAKSKSAGGGQSSSGDTSSDAWSAATDSPSGDAYGTYKGPGQPATSDGLDDLAAGTTEQVGTTDATTSTDDRL